MAECEHERLAPAMERPKDGWPIGTRMDMRCVECGFTVNMTVVVPGSGLYAMDENLDSTANHIDGRDPLKDHL